MLMIILRQPLRSGEGAALPTSPSFRHQPTDLCGKVAARNGRRSRHRRHVGTDPAGATFASGRIEAASPYEDVVGVHGGWGAAVGNATHVARADSGHVTRVARADIGQVA